MPDPIKPDRPLRVYVADSIPCANASCHPFPTLTPSLKCLYPGWCLEILSQIAFTGNITIEWVIDNLTPGESVDWGTYLPNHTFSGVIGDIVNDKYDTACLFYQQSTIRAQFVNFSVPVSQITPVFIVREMPVSFGSIIWTFLYPFTFELWLLLLVSFLIHMLIAVWVGRLEINLEMREDEDSVEFAWRVVHDFFNPEHNNFTSVSGFTTRLIFSVFLVGLMPELYKSRLLTARLDPKTRSPIQNADDVLKLVKDKEYILACSEDMWFYQEIQYSNDPFFRSLRDATKDNPIFNVDNETAMVNKLLEPTFTNFIYQSQQDDTGAMAAYANCYAVVITQGLPEQSTHFIWKPGNPWREVLDKQIMMNYEYSDAVYQKYFVDRLEQQHKQTCPPEGFVQPSAGEPLQIYPVLGIFFVLAGGGVVGAVSLLVERLIIFRRRRHKNRHQALSRHHTASTVFTTVM